MSNRYSVKHFSEDLSGFFAHLIVFFFPSGRLQGRHMDRRVSEYHHPHWHHGSFSQGDPIFLMLIAINFVKTLVILRTDAIGFLKKF